MYSKEQLISFNWNYHFEHKVTDGDVEKINALIQRMEATRQTDIPVPTDGDIVICVTSMGKMVSDNGHIQWRHSMSDSATICTHPIPPFISSESLRSDASGGYWISLEESDLSRFEWTETREKIFWTWGHRGMCGGGGIEFRAKVHVWRFTHPSFY